MTKDWRRWTSATTVALVVGLAFACTNAGRPDEVTAPEAREDTAPGDPAVYAPRGWPVQIGERVTGGQRRELATGFPSGGWGTGLHLVGHVVYAAEFEWRPGARPGDEYHFVYIGHFPLEPQRLYLSEDEVYLPEHLRGRIGYRDDTLEEQEWDREMKRRVAPVIAAHRERHEQDAVRR